MALLSFKERFADKVEDGSKLQTIRNFRKHPITVGERLYLYFGARTKWCKKLGEGVCTEAWPVTITKSGVTIYQPAATTRITSSYDLDVFAVRDGFTSWEEMRKWWILTHGNDCFPFRGMLYCWDLSPKNEWLKQPVKRREVAHA